MRFIREQEVRGVLNERLAFRLAEQAFRAIARGDSRMPPKIYLRLPGQPYRDFRAMPAYLDTRGRASAGIKWVCVFPDNRSKGLPTVSALIILNSTRNGMPIAVIEAGTLTAVRTAAAAAVATRYLAVRRPKKLAIIGAGLQARHQLSALSRLYPFKTISVWGYQKGESARFVSAHKRAHPRLTRAGTVRDAVRDADIIVTCTPSERPLVRLEWVKKGAHINAIGADAKGKQELDPKILKRAKVVVDEWEQASHSGEINVPMSRGLFRKKDLHAELAHVVSGRRAGRTDPREITVFDSTGLAVLDIHFARHVLDALS